MSRWPEVQNPNPLEAVRRYRICKDLRDPRSSFFQPQRVGDSKATNIRGVGVPRGDSDTGRADHVPRSRALRPTNQSSNA